MAPENEPQQVGDTSNVFCRSSPVHGTGVFAAIDLSSGDVIEVCPVLIVPAEHVEAFNTTGLDHHCYAWSDGAVAIALGLGSLYNHSFHPNARFDTDADTDTITITAIRGIAEGEEITFNYLGDSTDPAGLWFDLHD